ncbi:MAG TPA: tetratricopeptide repeat protein, partial [Acidimicrobiales bacterium]
MPSRQEARQVVARAREVAEQDHDILGPHHPETLRSQLKLAKALVDAGESRSAIALLGKLLPLVREEHGETSRETLRVEELLAPVQRGAGALHIVKTRQEILLTAVTRDWGEDSDITFWVMRELAKTLLDLGSIGEADVLLQSTLDRCLRVHGDRHMETLRTLAWLANAKRKAGDYQRA